MECVNRLYFISCDLLATCEQASHPDLFISVSPSDTVLHTVREKEKNYTSDQNDPDVVQPYAAYSPAGHPKVKHCINTSEILFRASLTIPDKPQHINYYYNQLFSYIWWQTPTFKVLFNTSLSDRKSKSCSLSISKVVILCPAFSAGWKRNNKHTVILKIF